MEADALSQLEEVARDLFRDMSIESQEIAINMLRLLLIEEEHPF